MGIHNITIILCFHRVKPSNEMQGALKVLNDALLRGRTTQQVTNAISIILHEWFRVSSHSFPLLSFTSINTILLHTYMRSYTFQVAGTKTANPLDVEDYLDNFENYSPQLLRYIVNMPDGNVSGSSNLLLKALIPKDYRFFRHVKLNVLLCQDLFASNVLKRKSFLPQI